MPTQTDTAARPNRNRWRILDWRLRALKQKYVYTGRFVYMLYAVADNLRMNDDPFRWVNDAPLFIVPRTLDALRSFREGAECGRSTVDLVGLVDRLLAGIEAHPTRFWVLKQVQKTLEAAEREDAMREELGPALQRLLGLVGIERADGFLAHYLEGR